MEENLIKVLEYELSRDIIEKCSKEGREITSKDVETEIHILLKDHQIEYKNKLREEWKPKAGMSIKVKDYCLIVEVYVKESQNEKAKELINKYLQ